MSIILQIDGKIAAARGSNLLSISAFVISVFLCFMRLSIIIYANEKYILALPFSLVYHLYV